MYPNCPNVSLVLLACRRFVLVGLAMEDGEDRRPAGADAVDRVSVSVRGSRPIGPPPTDNTFDVPQPSAVGATGTLQIP